MGFIQIPQRKRIQIKLANTRRLRKARAEHREWLASHGLDRKRPKQDPGTLVLPIIKDRTGVPCGNRPPVAVKGRQEQQTYSGERKLIGIATMHKSNMVPVFDEQSAKDIAKMRRG
jgi:hypothetical protein